MVRMSFPTLQEVIRAMSILLEQQTKDLMEKLDQRIEKFELGDTAEEDLVVEGVGGKEEEEGGEGETLEMEAANDSKEKKEGTQQVEQADNLKYVEEKVDLIKGKDLKKNEGIQQAGQAQSLKYVAVKLNLIRAFKRQEKWQERVLDRKVLSHAGLKQKLKAQASKQEWKDGVQYLPRVQRDYKRRKIYEWG